MTTNSEIAIEARASLTKYCIEICKSQCCKRGALVLFNKEELKRVANGKLKEYTKQNIITKTLNGNYRFDLKKLGKCPNLKDNCYCSIHEKKNYPQICLDYPIFIVKEKFLIIDDNCPAIKEKILNSYIKKMQESGLKLI